MSSFNDRRPQSLRSVPSIWTIRTEDLDDTDQQSLYSLMEVEPSPVDESPVDVSIDSYLASQKSESSPPPTMSHSSTLGLNGHGPVWYLTRIQKYSSYAFTIYTAFHITNTSLIPLFTRSIPASDSYLLLTRPYYQSLPFEPLLVAGPLVAHITSGIALRLYRRQQNLKRYGGESRRARRRIAWPKVSGTSALGLLATPLVLGHAFANRVLPLYYEGGNSNIGLEYISHGFAKHPFISFAGFSALVSVAVWHAVWGWAKWLQVSPAYVIEPGPEGQLKKKRRWYLVNAAAATAAGVWLAGSLGVVGKAGPATGWVARDYDELYARIPLVGQWL